MAFAGKKYMELEIIILRVISLTQKDKKKKKIPLVSVKHRI